MIIYIASPYTNYCDKQAAVDVQIDTFAILRDLGHEPIAPLLSHYIDQRHHASYERWMQWCLAMVGVCDVLLRLPGDSDGADREEAEARRLGKPVVYSIDEIAPYKFIYASELHSHDFTIDDVRIAPGDYPPINFGDHSHRNIADELSPLHWFGRENDGTQIRQGYTWAEFQAANQAAKDDIAAFVGGKRD